MRAIAIPLFPMPNVAEHISIFITYSNADQAILDMLLEHLRPLLLSGLANEIHHAGSIEAGLQWEKETQAALSKADIVLLLISSDFMACEQTYDKDMQAALNLQEQGIVRTVPILARACLWEDAPFAHLPMLPAGGTRAISDDAWTSPDEPYVEVVRGLRELILQLKGVKKAKVARGESIESRRIALFEKQVSAPVRRKGFALKIFGLPIISVALTLGLALLVGIPMFLNLGGGQSTGEDAIGGLRHLPDTISEQTVGQEKLSDQPAAVSAGIYQDPATKKYGIVQPDGDRLAAIYIEMDSFSDGLAAAKGAAGWGYVNALGDTLIPFRYQKARRFLNGEGEVWWKNKPYRIDKSGTITEKK